MYLQAYATDHAGLTNVEAVALFIQFVPLEGELLDFFHPLTSQILNSLRGTNCFPTNSLNLPDESAAHFDLFAHPTSQMGLEAVVQWRQPSQTVYVKSEFIREHINPVILQKALNLSYLNSEMLTYVNSSLKNQLSVQDLKTDHLKEVAQAMVKCYCGTLAKSGSWNLLIKWISHWMACVHVLMEETNQVDSVTFDTFKDLPILPLQNQTLATAAEGGIFFPPESTGTKPLYIKNNCTTVLLDRFE